MKKSNSVEKITGIANGHLINTINYWVPLSGKSFVKATHCLQAITLFLLFFIFIFFISSRATYNFKPDYVANPFTAERGTKMKKTENSG